MARSPLYLNQLVDIETWVGHILILQQNLPLSCMDLLHKRNKKLREWLLSGDFMALRVGQVDALEMLEQVYYEKGVEAQLKRVLYMIKV
jgi:hypothetical protein